MTMQPGTQIGPYQIASYVGAGGMGEVWGARDTRLHRDVAVKDVRGSADPLATARFQREGQAIAALNQPNICSIHDVGEHEGRPFLVMELLEGETLYQRLVRGPFELAALLDHAIALADALDAAHGRDLIHRDLKPANILLTKRGDIKVLDFGLAKLTDASAPPDRARRRGRLVTIGSPRHHAPRFEWTDL
jgi:serine/threonine protein kinase